jgi:hypothetical protein
MNFSEAFDVNMKVVSMSGNEGEKSSGKKAITHFCLGES